MRMLLILLLLLSSCSHEKENRQKQEYEKSDMEFDPSGIWKVSPVAEKCFASVVYTSGSPAKSLSNMFDCSVLPMEQIKTASHIKVDYSPENHSVDVTEDNRLRRIKLDGFNYGEATEPLVQLPSQKINPDCKVTYISSNGADFLGVQEANELQVKSEIASTTMTYIVSFFGIFLPSESKPNACGGYLSDSRSDPLIGVLENLGVWDRSRAGSISSFRIMYMHDSHKVQ